MHGNRNVKFSGKPFVLGIGLKIVQWTETCPQVYSVDYWNMLCFDWINYCIVIQHNGMAAIKWMIKNCVWRKLYMFRWLCLHNEM